MKRNKLYVRNIHGIEYPNLHDREFRRSFTENTDRTNARGLSTYYDAPLEIASKAILTATAKNNPYSSEDYYVQKNMQRLLGKINDERIKVPIWFIFRDAEATATIDKRWSRYTLDTISIQGIADAIVVPQAETEISSTSERFESIMQLKPVGMFNVCARVAISGYGSTSEVTLV